MVDGLEWVGVVVWTCLLFVGVVVVSAAARKKAGPWLYPMSAVCFVMGLICSESVHFLGFWPDFWMVLSLGLILAALMYSMEEHVGLARMLDRGASRASRRRRRRPRRVAAGTPGAVAK